MSRNPLRLVRSIAQFKPNLSRSEKMSAWQIHSYGELDELKLSKSCRIPHIIKPDQVLVKVEAASVNPIDVAMIGGYGSKALNLMRNMDNIEFPLTLGRDFCGTVVSKGMACDKVSVGSSVWGVIPVHQQGCHAEYVLVNSNHIGKRPENISETEAASVLYTGLTAWSGLMFSAGLKLHSMTGLKALVLGASGGVGNAAVQMLKSGGAHVTATCANDALPFVESLGVDNVLDYSSSDFDQRLTDFGRFDLVMDCAGLGSQYATTKSLMFRNYVTFTTPLLKNFDNLGLARGTLASISNLLCPNVQALKTGGVITWAYFVPSEEGIGYIYNLVKTGKMKPNVEDTYKFIDLPAAYKRVQDGHLRGKTVITIENSFIVDLCNF